MNTVPAPALRWARRRLLVLCLGGAACAAGVAAEPPQVLRLARLEGVPDQWVGGEILKAVYARLGIELQFVEVPPLRSLRESSEGHVDGEVQRILAVESQYPTLRAVRPSINYIEPSAFVKGRDFKVEGWASIEGMRVGIVRGVGSSEAGTRGMSQVTAVASMEVLMRMLAADRIDVAANDRLSGQLVLRRLGLEAQVRALEPPLQHIPLFHFLHVRHAALLPRVEEVLRGMATSGELERLRLKAVKTLFEQAGVQR